MTRAAMWFLLAVVATAAAVLSFSALRDLALLCGFAEHLAWLLPIVIDAGAATGCLVWVRADRGSAPTSFARSLTWLLLGSSVAGNALIHGLTAYSLRPTWWTVVIVSAIAPAVLGAVVHLAVLVGRGADDPSTGTPPEGYAGTEPPHLDPVDELIGQGVGRRRLARETGLTEYEARKLLAGRNGVAR